MLSDIKKFYKNKKVLITGNTGFNNLHRWCHPKMENYTGCTHDIFLRKIDFANLDNSSLS